MRYACSHAKAFVHKDLQFSKININDFCKYQSTEACAIKLEPSPTSICIITIYIYTAPSGNLKLFINGLDNII